MRTSAACRFGLPALLLFACCFVAEPVQASGLSSKLGQVEYSGTPLGDVIEDLRHRSRALDPKGQGVNFLLGPGVDRKQEVSLQLHETTLGVALLCLCGQADLDYRMESHACVIVPQGTGDLADRGAGSEKGASSAQAARAKRAMIPQLQFEEAPLGDVLAHLAKAVREHGEGQGINLVLNHRVDPELPVTLDLRNVPASSVLRWVTEMCDVELRIEPYAIIVEPPGDKERPE